MAVGRWTWLVNFVSLAAWVAVALAASVVLVVGVRWLVRPAPDQAGQADQSLEAQWNSTIKQLGIEPIYPPAEDLAVGDLLAEIVEDDQRDRSIVEKKGPQTPSLGKSVKLAHVNVVEELNQEYDELPFFPAATDIPVENTQRSEVSGPKSGSAPTSVVAFKSNKSRTVLPRAAFPGFTIVHVGSAAAGLSSTRYGHFQFGASREALQKLEVRLVETYGLPAVSADQALRAYCGNEKTRSVCSETKAREQLRWLVGDQGDRLSTCYVDPTTGRTYPAVTVKVFMVSRVYLAHSIRSQSTDGSSERGEVTAPSRAKDDIGGSPPSSQPSPAVGGVTPDSGGPDSALKKRLDELEKQLKELRQEGGLTYRTASERETQLDQTFPRGVVIGYRSVPHEFENDKFECPKP